MDASNKQPSTAEKFAAVWEKKNAKAARAGGVSLMALSLAACGGSSSTTTTTSTSTDTTTTVTPVSTALTVGNDALTGTAGDDTFTGARIDTIATFTGGDTIAAGAGTDTLTATITGNVAPADGAITGLENLVITNLMGNTATITFSTATTTGIAGVTNVSNVGSSSANNLVLTRIVDNASITLNNTAGDTTVTFADSALTGTADTLTLNVNGNTGAVNIGDSTGGGDAFESVTINSTGATSTFSAANLDATATAVTVTGNALLDVSGADTFAKLATLTAADSTGGVRIDIAADTVSGATNTKTITGSSAADQIDIDAIVASTVGAVTVNMGAGDDTLTIGTIANDYTLNGGAGTDTISFNALPTLATAQNVEGFEVATSTVGIASNTTTTLSMAVFNNDNAFERVNVSGALAADDGTDDIFAITNATSSITTVGFAITDTSGNDGEVHFSRVVDGSADSLTFIVTASGGGEIDNITANDEETITLNSGTGAIALDTGLTSTDLTSLTIVGDNAVDLSAVAAASLATVDATGLTVAAGLTITSTTSTAAMTVTGNAAESGYTGILTVTTGTGNDTITATANNDVIVGGDGNDTISGLGGDDDLTGGAGNDTLLGGAGADTLTGGAGSDTITGGAGVDIFSIGAGSDTVTDFVTGSGSSADTIQIDVSSVEALSGMDLVNLDDAASTGDTDDISFFSSTGVVDLDSSGANDTIILIEDVNIADHTALKSALALGGVKAIDTGATNFELADGIMVMYDNGVDTTLSAIEFTTDLGTDDTVTTAEMIVTDIATFTGIADCGDILEAQMLTFIA